MVDNLDRILIKFIKLYSYIRIGKTLIFIVLWKIQWFSQWLSLDHVLLEHHSRNPGKQELEGDSKLHISFQVRREKTTVCLERVDLTCVAVGLPDLLVKRRPCFPKAPFC